MANEVSETPQLEFVKKTSPYIRKQTSTKRILVDVLIALCPLVIYAIIAFGVDAFVRIITAIGLAIVIELISAGFRKTEGDVGRKGFDRFKYRIKNIQAVQLLSGLVTSIIYVLLFPSSMPFFPLIVGLILGLVIGKVVFGGFGQNIFNPAAVGRIIIGVSFASSFVYTGVFTDPGVGSTILSSISSSPSAITDILSRYPLSSIFLGTIPGSMGEISSLLIILSCLYLLIRKAIDWRIVFSSIISLVIFSVIGAIALDVDILNFSLVQLFAGGFLFGAVFMATDPVTTPITGHGRVLYGFVFGLLVALIRFFGAFPEGVAFSILILNCFTPLIDYHKFNTNHKKAWLYTLVIIGVALLIFVPVIVLNYK